MAIAYKFLLALVPAMIWSGISQAEDCSGLPEWKRQHYYLLGAQVQYKGYAYQNGAESSKRDFPDEGDPWVPLGACDTPDPGGGGDNGDGGGGDPAPISIFGVWHCGNTFCDWSQVRNLSEFDEANRWIIDRDLDDTNGYQPSVNLVVLSFLQPLALLQQRTDEAFVNGIPKGMTSNIVNYFKSKDIRVLVSMGGVTYTDYWNQALLQNAAALADAAEQAVIDLEADGLEIDWENGRPSADEMTGIQEFLENYDKPSGTVLTLDLAVGNRYLQELSRRAAGEWLPSGKIDYINAMVPRGEPSIDQWQEHIDGKANYDPPILPKAPAKIAVSLWLTDSRRPNANCVDFAKSSQLEKAEFVQHAMPNGAGNSKGLLGFMFWAAECPSARNVCTTPPNSCEGGMGAAASHFDIPLPLDFSLLRPD
jgi:hypothetical protein